jgi:hypothetical protein
MIDARMETRGEDSECATIRPPPKETCHPTHIRLASRTFRLPVDDPHVTAMSKNRTVHLTDGTWRSSRSGG